MLTEKHIDVSINTNEENIYIYHRLLQLSSLWKIVSIPKIIKNVYILIYNIKVT